MKVAIVYDRVNKWGGAERVLLALRELFPDAPLYTSVYNPKKAPWANVFDVKTSFLQRLPMASSNHEFFPALMPIAFESLSFDEYDLVVSVTSEAAKGIITKPKTKHISYILTPTRYLWSGYEEYFGNKAFKLLSKPVVQSLRVWDKIAAHRPDMLVGISEEVRERIKKYYGRDSELVYPPLTLNSRMVSNKDRIDSNIFGKNSSNSGKGYFLVVSRFVPYKRIDIAIEACNRLKLPLKIIGSGREEKHLRAIAGPTIEFVGKVTDEQLAAYYMNCKALIFPGVEDFGLTVIEAQNFGKPVIAFRKGGAVETILDKKTGVFFDEQKTAALMSVLKDFDKIVFDEDAFVRQVNRFSFGNFKKEFLRVVNKIF
jgi:glycosyltransferase involved in cell wall biosynthesis